MKRVYCALSLAVLMLVSSAAAPIAKWKRIVLKDAGTIVLPDSWNVITENLPVLENAYGPGVTSRCLMTAENDDKSLMSVLVYWPSEGRTSSQAAGDIASSLRRNNAVSSPPLAGEIRTKDITASSVTYQTRRNTHQKVAAFIHDNKIFCIISDYSSSDEHAFTE